MTVLTLHVDAFTGFSFGDIIYIHAYALVWRFTEPAIEILTT
jgi:hypothetical protein